MLFRLIAIIVLALGVAGIVILLNRYVFGRKLPRWTMPVAIAAAILGFQIYEEYNWYPRTMKGLSEDYAVINMQTHSAIWRPWSLIWPSVTSMSIVDKNHLQSLDDNPEINVGMVASLTSFGARTDVPFAFNCVDAKFAPFRRDIETIEWADMDDDLLAKLCVEYD